jgi:hypothetical protein
VQLVAERAILGMNASMMALGQRQHGQQGLAPVQSELAMNAIRAQQSLDPGMHIQDPGQSAVPKSIVEGPQGPAQEMRTQSAAVVIVSSFSALCFYRISGRKSTLHTCGSIRRI